MECCTEAQMSVKYCNALKDPSHTEEGFEAEEAITISVES